MIILDDTYTFADFGLIELQGHEHPMTPVVEQKTLAIPGRSGLWHFGTENREKQFAVPLGIIEYDKYERQRKLNELVVFLHDHYGQPREIKWVYDYEPDKFYTVKLAEQINPDRLVHAARFTLAFVAYDPRKKYILENHEINWGNEIITMGEDIPISHTFVNNMRITHAQRVETYVQGLAVRPTIIIDGTGHNVIISANGKYFSLGTFINTKFVLRGSDYTVYKNGTPSIISGEFLELLPGMNKILITGVGLNFKLSVNLRDEFI